MLKRYISAGLTGLFFISFAMRVRLKALFIKYVLLFILILPIKKNDSLMAKCCIP